MNKGKFECEVGLPLPYVELLGAADWHHHLTVFRVVVRSRCLHRCVGLGLRTANGREIEIMPVTNSARHALSGSFGSR